MFWKKDVELSIIAGPLSTTGATPWMRMRTPASKTFHAHLDVAGNTGVSATVKIQLSNNGVDPAGNLATFALSNTVTDDGWPNAVPWGYYRVNVTDYEAGSGGGTPTITVTMGEE